MEDSKILLLDSPLREMIWGGSYFKNVLHLTEEDNTFGEYWTISGYKDYPSIIKNGKYQGESLEKIYREHHELFASSSSIDFPILVKLIATSADLSVQVHPNDEYASQFNELGKTESWLILSSDHGKICYGHSLDCKEVLEQKIRGNDFSFLNYYDVKKGQFIKVNAGTVHALGKGLVLLEVQESSNLTYRLYDYDRRDKNGNLRELHIDKSLDVISVPNNLTIDETNYLELRDDVTLWDNDLFKIILINVRRQIKFMMSDGKYYLCSVASGKFNYNGTELKVGESFIVTSLCDNEVIKGKGKLVVVESYR